jgi:hypothetical protein
MAKFSKKTFGGKPKPITAPRGVTGGWYPPPGVDMLQAVGSPSRVQCGLCGGLVSRELSGGNWIASLEL